MSTYLIPLVYVWCNWEGLNRSRPSKLDQHPLSLSSSYTVPTHYSIKEHLCILSSAFKYSIPVQYQWNLNKDKWKWNVRHQQRSVCCIIADAPAHKSDMNSILMLTIQIIHRTASSPGGPIKNAVIFQTAI